VNALKVDVLVVVIEIGLGGRRDELASRISPIIQRVVDFHRELTRGFH
jgi:hypothetical protein